MPKILSDDVPMRTLVRQPQLAEQLVEVPTIVSWSLLQLIMRNVFLSGLWNRLLIFPVEAIKIFSQHSVLFFALSSWCSEVLDDPGERFFALDPNIFFFKKKSATLGQGSELSADFTSSTSAAHVDSLAVVDLLNNFKQLSDQVGEMDRRSKYVAQGFRRISICFTASSPRRGIVFNKLEASADEVGSWGSTCGAALLWLMSYKSGPGWCVSSGLPSHAVASGAAAGAG